MPNFKVSKFLSEQQYLFFIVSCRNWTPSPLAGPVRACEVFGLPSVGVACGGPWAEYPSLPSAGACYASWSRTSCTGGYGYQRPSQPTILIMAQCKEVIATGNRPLGYLGNILQVVDNCPHKIMGLPAKEDYTLLYFY